MSTGTIGSVAVATVTSNTIGMLLGVMQNTATQNSSTTRNASQAPVVDARRHIQPEDSYEPRKVIHPTARYEARQVFMYDPTLPATSAGAKTKQTLGLPLPVPATPAHIAARVRQYQQANGKSSLLDLFV